MHLGPTGGVPPIDPVLVPPLVHGTAALAHRAFAGAALQDLLNFLARPVGGAAEEAALLLDAALAHELCFQREHWPVLQSAALGQCRLFRVAPGCAPRSPRPLRLLALVAPGNLMMNTPLDFITAHLDVQLDLMFAVPGQPLPPALPEHDAAFFAVSESDPGTLDRLAPLFRAWRRPVLNDPAAVSRLSREVLPQMMAGLPGLLCPEAVRVPRAVLAAGAAPMLAPRAPVLIRPAGSHAGHGLQKIDDPAALPAYLRQTDAEAFHVTRFVDYRSADGLYRKLRIVLIDGRPMLCHMASSEHWMVHYLNAGMAEHAARRQMEAEAMAGFDAGFAARHRQALAGMAERFGLDYVQIDCGEMPDGRLVLFEADVAAIIHLMDPPDLFPYKQVQMRRVFAEFEAMLRRRASEAGAG